MRGRAYLLALALLGVAATETHDDARTRFLIPSRDTIVLRPTTISVQWYITRHKDNRAYVVTCRGACHWTAGPEDMDGEDDAAIMPMRPVLVTLDRPGLALLSLAVYGPGGKLRETAERRITVCGSDEPCM